ncbi:MAG: hypothetical protein DME67_05005 [Verrucomicrobia bacterium]|nr:MAG: hypothetical protein DME95_10590 [Verrucomicrobiota bacterium]PYK05519.1 MAG: hypothetical protein DME67_05005 [Verrucomicrobiota bacterium]
MVSDAQATTKEAIMLLTNFILISIISFHCFGRPWLPTVGGHIRPFIVFIAPLQRKKMRSVSKKMASPRIRESKTREADRCFTRLRRRGFDAPINMGETVAL